MGSNFPYIYSPILRYVVSKFISLNTLCGVWLNLLLRAHVDSGALMVTLVFIRVEVNSAIHTIIAPLHMPGNFFAF